MGLLDREWFRVSCGLLSLGAFLWLTIRMCGARAAKRGIGDLMILGACIVLFALAWGWKLRIPGN